MIAQRENRVNRRVRDAKAALASTRPPDKERLLDGTTAWSLAGVAFAGGLMLGLTRSARPLAKIALRLATEVLAVAASGSNPDTRKDHSTHRA